MRTSRNSHKSKETKNFTQFSLNYMEYEWCSAVIDLAVFQKIITKNNKKIHFAVFDYDWENKNLKLIAPTKF